MTQAPDRDSRFVLVTWHGPFGYDKNGLRRSRVDPGGPVGTDLRGLRGKSGIYVVIGDHPTYGARALLYIGRTNRFERRLNEEHEWIADEWRVEVYLGTLSDPSALNDVESLLIHAHSPPYCSKCIDGCTLAAHLRVWNDGRFWGLFPEVSSKHPWYPDIVVTAGSR